MAAAAAEQSGDRRAGRDRRRLLPVRHERTADWQWADHELPACSPTTWPPCAPNSWRLRPQHPRTRALSPGANRRRSASTPTCGRPWTATSTTSAPPSTAGAPWPSVRQSEQRQRVRCSTGARIPRRWPRGGSRWAPALSWSRSAPHRRLAVTRAGTVRLPAPPTTVVDTVAAGDTFTAGFLTWLHNARPLGSTLSG